MAAFNAPDCDLSLADINIPVRNLFYFFLGGGFCCVCGLFEIYDDYLSDELSLNSFDFVPFFQVVLSSSLARYLTLMIVSPARCYQLAVLLRLNFIIVVKCLHRHVKKFGSSVFAASLQADITKGR